MCGRWSGGTPGPSSVTSMVTHPPTANALIVPAVPAGGSVHEHVHEQVVDGAAQQFLVAGHGQAVGDPRLPAPPGVGDPRPLRASGDHGGEVDRLPRLTG